MTVGVVCTLRTEETGEISLVLDDVRGDGQTWKKTFPYTERRWPKEKFSTESLSDDDLMNIGLALVARLLASTEPAKQK